MSDGIHNKVDMSLDDIIKISKAEKRKKIQASRQQRGRGQQRGTGSVRGQGVMRGRGQGRGRGAVVRGRGRGKLPAQAQANTQQQIARGGNRRGRGRGGGITRQNSGVSPLNRLGFNQNVRGRGRGQVRGRGRGRGGGAVRGSKALVFTNSGNVQSIQTAKTATQQLRLSKANQAAKLLREKQLALQNLQQAKKNMQSINQALQKSSREAVVNQRRGIPNNNGQQAGRGRAKLLTPLMRQPGNISSTRQLINTSVTIANPSASPVNAPRGGKRRGWRRRPSQGAASQDHFTIQVANQNAPAAKKDQSSIMDQLKMLKPAVTTVYKFQKNVFATPATGISLNDRFASSGSSRVSEGGDDVEGRKVFI
ncbi:UAP56-interacting factor [Aplysia californica]|uniref:UAP56-interacting factor n=1 Tax=Aplysia californica TaxID=6500 RepID=A0ABM0K9N6_APLCA|nr:UAP56-interacting factor [Aplysia californica]